MYKNFDTLEEWRDQWSGMLEEFEVGVGFPLPANGNFHKSEILVTLVVKIFWC